ncbi:MAG: DUF2142 domain-containing protein, partial [Bacteroidota bacterium]
MKLTARIITGTLFLTISLAAIILIRINPVSPIPSRSTVERKAATLSSLGQKEVVTQGFYAKSDYLNGIDLMFTHAGRKNSNQNTLLVLDSSFNVLYRQLFSSQVLKEGNLSKFRFKMPVFVGKGKLIYLSLFSIDGTETNCPALLLNMADSVGIFSVTKIRGDDVMSAIKDQTRHFHACLMFQSYTTRYSQFWFLKYLLGVIALIISLVIVLYPWIRVRLAKTRIVPEWIYLGIALPGSVAFALVTPPTQVPDEGSHFCRAYEISELRVFSNQKTVPLSILRLDSAFSYLHTNPDEKTTFGEISRQTKISLEPTKRGASNGPAYTLPYIPQAIGIIAGRIFDASPLTLMYLGRLFNLLLSVVIIFFAIRLIPAFKWLLLLLALMPKTLFLFGSLSYDTLTISLSFLTIAIFLYYAFSCKRSIGFRDLGLMALMILLLLLCKPPYFLIGLLFFFIPPAKFGKLYRYIMIAIGVVVLGVVMLKVIPAAVNSFSVQDATAAQYTGSPANPSDPYRPAEQMRLIRSDIPGYINLMLKSGFVVNRDYIVESFFGLLGWIDVDMPFALTFSYFVILFLCALVLTGSDLNLGPAKKILLLVILALAYVIIQTGLYLYATLPGNKLMIWGVQGRYFIPLAPLF